MTKDDFLNQPLPKSDPNANLESLSRTRFRELLGVQDFQLRDEHESDHGIDLFVEIKAHGKHLNLRFPIQLKATSSVKVSQTGSISFSIKVSNINYLMNDGLPAFYILYHQPTEVFYYERASEVEARLLEKYPNGNYPESFSFTFDKVLDQSVLQSIHGEMISLGLLRRNLTGALKLTADGSMLTDTLVIKQDQQVYSATERIRFLEKYGFRLLNEARFKVVIEIEQQCYPLEKVSAAFHFVCGTAYFYTSQLYKALEHYKKAQKHKAELSPEVQQMMDYYVVQSKRSLNMIDAERTSGYVKALMDSQYLGLHLKLEKAFERYYGSAEKDEQKLKAFQDIVDGVLGDPGCDEHLALIAESYVLSAEGHRLNDDLLSYLLLTRDSLENPLIDPSQYKPRQDQIDHYNAYFKALKAKALAHNNQYTYNIICLNGIKVQYVQTYYTDIILGIDKKTLTVNSVLNAEDLSRLAEQARYVEEIATVYEQLGSMDNAIAALSQRYELLHLMQDFEHAALVLKKMEELIAEHDLHGLEDKVALLKNGGTAHELFAAMVLGSLAKSGERRNEAHRLIEEMQQMDLEDKQRPLVVGENVCQVQLIPLGLFCFDRSFLDRFFSILNVTTEAQKGFVNMIGKMIPIANLYNDPIVKEGPANGEADNKGLESLTRVYQVSIHLREMGAYRVYPKFGG